MSPPRIYSPVPPRATRAPFEMTYRPLIIEQEQLSAFSEEDYLILDCPGQVELYSHIPVMKHFVDFLKVRWGLKREDHFRSGQESEPAAKRSRYISK
jgi:GTPase SAR1 family protein